jgi:hypothetical protein
MSNACKPFRSSVPPSTDDGLDEQGLSALFFDAAGAEEDS